MAKTYLKIEQEDGSFLEFRKEKIKAHWLKEHYKLDKEITALNKKGNFWEAIDAKADYVVSLFNDPRLTKEVMYNGIDSDQLIPELNRISDDIVGRKEEDGKTGKS